MVVSLGKFFKLQPKPTERSRENREIQKLLIEKLRSSTTDWTTRGVGNSVGLRDDFTVGSVARVSVKMSPNAISSVNTTGIRHLFRKCPLPGASNADGDHVSMTPSVAKHTSRKIFAEGFGRC